MKLIKTAVAVAIAGIASAPMIASADTTLSGVIEVNIAGDDGEGEDIDATSEVEGPLDDGDPRFAVGDVIVGVVSEQELNGGLTGYGSIRLDLDQLSNEGNNITTDNVYTGVKGGFGDIRVGEIPLAVEFGQTSNDIFDVGAEINGGISYTGSAGPVTLILNWSPDNNQDVAGAGIRFGLGGFAIGIGAEQRGDDEDVNAAVGISGALGGFAITANYWNQENNDVGGEDDLESYTVQVGFGVFGASASVTYAALDADIADQEAIRLDLAYDLGGGTTLSGRYTNFDGTAPGNPPVDDFNEYRVQLAKSF